MEPRKNPIILVIAVLVVLAGSIPGFALLLDDVGVLDGGSTHVADPRHLAPRELPGSLAGHEGQETVASHALLEALTDLNLSDPDPIGLLRALSGTHPETGAVVGGPQEILRTVATAYGAQVSSPELPRSESLRAALDRYAVVRGEPQLSRQEGAQVDELPKPLRTALIPAVDALAYATGEQQAALADLSAGDRRELIALAGEVMPTGNATPSEVRRFRNLSSNVDMGRMLGAAHALLSGVQETQGALGELLDHASRAGPQAGEPSATRAHALLSAEPQETSEAGSELRRAADHVYAGSPDETPRTAPSLETAIRKLVGTEFSGVTIDPDIKGVEALDRLPSTLRTSLSTLINAYAEAGSSSERSSGLLRATADTLPTLQAWSYLLSSTPPDTHFRTLDDVRARHAGLALATPHATTDLQRTLRLSADQAGLPAPARVQPIATGSPQAAMDAWEVSFGITRTPEEEARVEEALTALPTHIASALGTVLSAQAKAADELEPLELDPGAEARLAEAGATVDAVLRGQTTATEGAHALETFSAFTSEQQAAGLRAGMLLAAATDQARDLLEDPAGSDDRDANDEDDPTPGLPDQPPRRPDAPSTGPPGAPSTGAEPAGPLAQPSRDVWYADPSGLILVTGERSTTFPVEFLALSIDLGGDDVYPGNAGGVTSGSPTDIATAIDIGGNDHYATKSPYAQGAAATLEPATDPIVGILVDYHGDDTYRAGAFSQGASYMGGLGLLLDAEGDDDYAITGDSTDANAGFPVTGGQGYGFHAPGLGSSIYPPATGIHADVAGDDRYEAVNGQGSAMTLGAPRLSITGPRIASGSLFETGGSDEYACEDVCLGQGRFGTPAGIECGGRGGLCEQLTPSRPGLLVSTGTFVDTAGQDTYKDKGGPNDRVGPATEGAYTSLNPDYFPCCPEPGLRVNSTTRIDVSLGDENHDFVPDTPARSLGYDPAERGSGPTHEAYRALAPHHLATGPDRDGDGASDALERRLGTDPSDPRSAPVLPPSAASGNDADKLLVVSLDLTLGTSITQEGLPDRGPVGVIGVYPDGASQHPDGQWEGHGTQTDGTRVPLIGIGDSIQTEWLEDYPLTIDLGGPDLYENNAGGTLPPLELGDEDSTQGNAHAPSAFSLDLTGDDRYRSNSSVPTQGAGGYEGFGVLVDVLGDDRYTAREVAQGSAVGPQTTGVLADLSGDDAYTSTEAAQGFAAPSCSAAQQLIRHFDCIDASSCETNLSADVDPYIQEACLLQRSKRATTALLLDSSGNETYTGDGQGILEPRRIVPSGRCYGCPGEQTTGFARVDAYLPSAGAYNDPGSHTNLPAPADRQLDTTGDSATLVDRNGNDIYEVLGFREPTHGQGVARGRGPPGQGSAIFADLRGQDTYLQRPYQPGQAPRSYDKNNHVLLNGLPYTPEGERLFSVFLDAQARGMDSDGDALPDLAESLLGTRQPGREDKREIPTDPVNEDWDPREADHVNGSMITSATHLEEILGNASILEVPRLGIMISGTTDDVHTADQALLIDLGGDDTYEGTVGAGIGEPYDPTKTPIGVGVALDLSGSDSYQRHVEDPGAPTDRVLIGGTQGAGVLGIGLQIDPTGADRYNVTVDSRFSSGASSIGLAQGAGFQGVGLLLASEGASFNLRMTTDAPADQAAPSIGLVQGSAWSGLGLLHIAEGVGATEYNASVEPIEQPRAGAQGFSAHGVGLLVDPGPNSNRFNASGGAQGAALPMLLSDTPTRKTQGPLAPEGEPLVEAGNPAAKPFTGGLGLLVGGTRSDTYTARHTSQGLGVGRTWIGAIVEPGGEDAYRATPATGEEGAALSQGVGVLGGTGLLLDHAGDDTYWTGADARGLSAAQGAAVATPDTATALSGRCGVVEQDCLIQLVGTQGILSDLGGSDRYTARGNITQGGALSVLSTGSVQQPTPPSTYAQGLFHDTGGADTYQAPAAPGAVNTTVLLPSEETGSAIPTSGGSCQSLEPVYPWLNIALGLAGEALDGSRCRALLGDGGDDGSGGIGAAVPSTGLFLDSAGMDTYEPIPHPHAVPLASQVPCTSADAGAPSCPARDGAGNNELWSHSADPSRTWAYSHLSVATDAPSQGVAMRAASRLLAEFAGLPSGQAGLDVEAFEDPACTVPLDPSHPTSGEVCLQAKIRGVPGRPAARVEEVRFFAIDAPAGDSSRLPPTLIGTVPGQSSRADGPTSSYVLPGWNTTLPAYPDGVTIARARAVVDMPGSPRDVVLEDELQVTLDNAPWLEADLPRWYDPSQGPLSFPVHALGETGKVSGLISHPCTAIGTSLPEQEAQPRSPGATWNITWDLSACPDGDIVVRGFAEDDGHNRGDLHGGVLGIDRVAPTVQFDLPEHVNASLGDAGSFTIRWNTTDPFGNATDLDLAVRVNGEGGSWIEDAPLVGRSTWEQFGDGDTITVLGTATDQAGNRRTTSARTTVDLVPPTLQGPQVSPAYVRPGDPISFRVNATDNQAIAEATVDIDGHLYGLHKAAGGQGAQVWAFDGWSQVTRQLVSEHGANASRPEGYPFRFIFEDQAGNRATTVEDQVFIDAVPPAIGNVTLSYPKGQAAGPGDLVQIVADAHDGLALADTMEATVGNVSSEDTIMLRLNPATQNFTGSFVLDRIPTAGAPEIQVTAADEAGNRRTVRKQVAIATEPPTLEALHVAERTAASATLEWRTSQPSTANVVLTDTRTNQRRSLEAPRTTTEHRLTLDNLSPATRYLVDLLPLNAAGDTGDQRTLAFTTETAILPTLLAPTPGSSHAGQALVRWNATDPTNETMTFEIALRSKGELVQTQRTLLTLQAPQDTPQERTIDLTRVPDGTYDLVLGATRGYDRATTSLTNLTIDNTAPFIELLTPTPGATVPPGEIPVRVAALDRGTGVDPDRVTISLGENEQPATRATDGTFHASVPLESEGHALLEVTVEDEVGNEATRAIPLFISRDAPTASRAEAVLPENQSSAKPGDTVTVRFATPHTDRVDPVVRPSALTGPSSLPMVPDLAGFTATFTIPPNTTEGTHILHVLTQDEPGTGHRIPLEVDVDTSTPALGDVDISHTGQISAEVVVCADELVRARLTAEAPQGPPVTAREDGLQRCHGLRLWDLRPATPYGVEVTVSDAAGHTTTHMIGLTTDPDSQPPGPAGHLTARTPRAGVVALTWDDAPDDTGIAHYRITRESSNGAREPVANHSGTSFTDPHVPTGTTYTYTIEPVDLAGQVGPATSIHVTPRGPPSLEDPEVLPRKGTEATRFTFSVNYTGPLTDTTQVHVEIDGHRHPMTLQGAPSDCVRPCTFTYTTHLPAETMGSGGHDYRFLTNQHGFSTSLPEGGSRAGPIVTESVSSVPADNLAIGGAIAGTLTLGLASLWVFRRIGGGGP